MDSEVEGARGAREGEVGVLAEADVVVLTEVDDTGEELGGEVGDGWGGKRGGGKKEVGDSGDFGDEGDGGGIRESAGDGRKGIGD